MDAKKTSRTGNSELESRESRMQSSLHQRELTAAFLLDSPFCRGEMAV